MRTRVFGIIVKGAVAVLLLAVVLLFVPRILGFLSPSSPPVGYHADAVGYLALALGLERLVELDPPVPDTIERFMDIEYKRTGERSLQLDIYRPVSSGERPPPLLVFIHGGGWRGGSRSDYLRYLVDFAGQGYAAATVSYRLRHEARYPAAVEDIVDAVRWLGLNGDVYGYDPRRIALIGGSAGAHLAMLAAYGWEYGRAADMDAAVKVEELSPSSEAPIPGWETGIRAVAALYGPTDLTDPYARNHPLVTGFIGCYFEECPELYREASPVSYLTAKAPPTLLLHGTSDTLVPVSQADILAAALSAAGVPYRYQRLPLWPHTMDAVERVNRYVQRVMLDFFQTVLQ